MLLAGAVPVFGQFVCELRNDDQRLVKNVRIVHIDPIILKSASRPLTQYHRQFFFNSKIIHAHQQHQFSWQTAAMAPAGRQAHPPTELSAGDLSIATIYN